MDRYPGRDALCDYFDYVDSRIHFSDVTSYNTTVLGAVFDESDCRWTLRCDTGVYRCRWFLPNVGMAAKSYTPAIPGLDSFRGVIHHTAVSLGRERADDSIGLKRVFSSRGSVSL